MEDVISSTSTKLGAGGVIGGVGSDPGMEDAIRPADMKPRMEMGDTGIKSATGDEICDASAGPGTGDMISSASTKPGIVTGDASALRQCGPGVWNGRCDWHCEYESWDGNR